MPSLPSSLTRFAPWIVFVLAAGLFALGVQQWRDHAGDPSLIEAGLATAPTDVPATPPSPSPTAAAPVPAAGADPLATLYDELGLSVPLTALERDERPGCPPPPATPPSGGGAGAGTPKPPWTPPATVAEQDLPDPTPVQAWTSDSSPAAGKGMWIWKYANTENENFEAIVARAVAADLDHIWIRVGDTRDGFYAAERMDVLVPLAHEAGLDVIGWGFPLLHDPLEDADWTREVLAWRGPHGRGLDAFSPDIERASEGVLLSARRAQVYLAAVRADAGDMPILATVYPPEDWVIEAGYPFEAMAPYIDAYVPMDYWGCGDAGLMAQNSITRLAPYGRDVHVIGQAYGNSNAGRRVPPNQAETWRFLDVAVRHGAIGASFWVWESMGQEQWDALTVYPWDHAVSRS